MNRVLKQHGFSLVELLVTMVIMGLVMTAIYGLFLNSQKSSVTSEEVVDVQQNLRMAYDMIARDVRMAGFSHAQALTNIGDNQIDLFTASPYGRYARILDADDTGGSTTSIDMADGTEVYTFTIPREHAKSLRANHVFRICRPQDGTYLPNSADTEAYLVAVSGPTLVSGDRYSINMQVLDPGTGTFNFDTEDGGGNGDLLARVMVDSIATPSLFYYPYDNDPGNAPYVIRYQLLQTPDTSDDPDHYHLMRYILRSDGSDPIEQQILATKIFGATGLQFNYILNDNTVVAAAGVTNLEDVVGVQVRIVGSTDITRTGNENFSGVKTREILGRAHMKNRSITSGS